MTAAMANGGEGCVRTRERESEGEERKNRGRVREYGGGRGVVPGHPDEEGRGRQAGELVAWRGGARVRRAHSPPSVEDEDDRGGGGLGRLLAGPVSYCWAAQGGTQVSFSFYLFLLF